MSAKATSKLSRILGLLRFLIGLAIILLIGGYIAFLVTVTRSQPQSPVPVADGIVVLTGGSNRLSQAGALLTQDRAERLLVSGIDKKATAEDIRKLLGVSEAQMSCCVDLDMDAADTVGNARETAIWTNALAYEHIILVTSDYHMPRAKLEITSATGGLRITPYPVSTSGGLSIWKDGERLKTMAREYGKLLVIYISRMGDRPSFPPQPVPAPVDAMKDAQEPAVISAPIAAPNGEDAP